LIPSHPLMALIKTAALEDSRVAARDMSQAGDTFNNSMELNARYVGGKWKHSAGDRTAGAAPKSVWADPASAGRPKKAARAVTTAARLIEATPHHAIAKARVQVTSDHSLCLAGGETEHSKAERGFPRLVGLDLVPTQHGGYRMLQPATGAGRDQVSHHSPPLYTRSGSERNCVFLTSLTAYTGQKNPNRRPLPPAPPPWVRTHPPQPHGRIWLRQAGPRHCRFPPLAKGRSRMAVPAVGRAVRRRRWRRRRGATVVWGMPWGMPQGPPPAPTGTSSSSAPQQGLTPPPTPPPPPPQDARQELPVPAGVSHVGWRRARRSGCW